MSVSDVEDTNEDMDPAFAACEMLEEFAAGSADYPAAFDREDPATYSRSRCQFMDNEAVTGSKICGEL